MLEKLSLSTSILGPTLASIPHDLFPLLHGSQGVTHLLLRELDGVDDCHGRRCLGVGREWEGAFSPGALSNIAPPHTSHPSLRSRDWCSHTKLVSHPPRYSVYLVVLGHIHTRVWG